MTVKAFLVAHRGQPDSFPENSLEGFRYVLESGAVYLETDVQLTSDDVVILSHDENLKKLTGKNISVTKNTYSSFQNVPAGFTGKFSNTFGHCRISTLKQFSSLLLNWPGVICFIEIKQESLSCFGNKVVDRVVEALEPIKEQSVLISFDYDALVYARENYHSTVGWVLPKWSKSKQLKADKLSPEYLFVDADICPDDKELWLGSWQWVVYTISSVEEIKAYLDIGITLIETNRINDLQHEYDKAVANSRR